MIHIGKPYIEEKDGKTFLISNIKNELENKDINVFFAVEPEFANYLCHEQADAFVVSMLLRAVVTGQDIEVDAPISEKLLHNLRYGVIHALTTSLKQNKNIGYNLEILNRYKNNRGNKSIQVISKKGVVSQNYNGSEVGTGCSLGVDSFSIIKKYLLERKKESLLSYKITHFACFNVGALGMYNTESTRESFYREVNRIKQFASKFNIPVVSIDTNLHEFYPEYNFNWSHSYLNMACVLSLQKLWGKYIYASGYSLNNFEFNISDSAKYEPFLLTNLSTESTELISGDMELSRADKVRYIMNDAIVKDNLNVCLKEQCINSESGIDNYNNQFINCGKCEKCLRTILQLEIYGKLEEYKDIIDLSEWQHLKPYYLGKVIACRKENMMYDDILNTITSEYHIPLFSKIYAKIYKPYQIIKKVLKRK